jgi:molybdopterin-guanine dinucleotide biosynthesis protein A
MSPACPSLLGAVLVGGASRRMGRAKALLERDGQALAERAATALAPSVEAVHWSGPSGAALPARPSLERIPDRHSVAGPLGGILGLFDHRPDAWWVVVACDLPRLERTGVAWLGRQVGLAHANGAIAVVPGALGRAQPLFAAYGPEARLFLEDLVKRGLLSPRSLAERPDVARPAVPAKLEDQWTNVNTPEEWRQLAEE